MQEDTNALREAVERLHGCKETLREIATVKEQFHGKAVWEGIVHVFDLQGHPSATTCYAWSSPVERSNRRRFYAVLGLSPVDSAANAVRVAIVSEERRKSDEEM